MTDEREGPKPIPMILHCPACGLQHIDAPDLEDIHWIDGARSIPWDNPPHRSHLCQGCGHIWRPADVPTEGVAAIATKGSNDSPASPSPAPATVPTREDTLSALLLAAKMLRVSIDELQDRRMALENCDALIAALNAFALPAQPEDMGEQG